MTDHNLTEQLFKLHSLIHKYSLQRYADLRRGGPRAPHRGQGRVLAMLKIQPEISQKELSYLLDIRPQSLGELLSKLESSGLITREPSESDKRVMNVKLTDSGAEAANETDKESIGISKILDVLTDEEKSLLSDYLQRVIAAFETEIGDEDMDYMIFNKIFDRENFKDLDRNKLREQFFNGQFPDFDRTKFRQRFGMNPLAARRKIKKMLAEGHSLADIFGFRRESLFGEQGGFEGRKHDPRDGDFFGNMSMEDIQKFHEMRMAFFNDVSNESED